MIIRAILFGLWVLLIRAQESDHISLSLRDIVIETEKNLLSEKPDADLVRNVLMEAACLDDGLAQALLGEFYVYGDFGISDPELGIMWLVRSAMQGNGYGELRLAEVYLESESPDYPEIINLLERSASKGQFHSYAHLGMMSMLGIGVPKDLDKTHFYLNEAAKGEDPMALLYLGKMSYHGEDAPQDYEKAFGYIRRAQIAGSREANVYLGLMYKYGYGIPVDLEISKDFFEQAMLFNDKHLLLLHKEINSLNSLLR